MMYLFACTNKHGSKSSTCLDYTKEEWDAMSEKERDEVVALSLGDIVDTWVQEGDED
jgi:hypothetical protein